MDYAPFDIDSSGTDDDLPPPTHQTRIPRVARFSGYGRSATPSSRPTTTTTRLYAEADMEVQIHQLEREAYVSVLIAFKAQAYAITWENESLITQLRKELRLSNEDHRQLLSQVNAAGLIKSIREWRHNGGLQSGIRNTAHGFQDAMPSPCVSASRKKQKPTQPVPSQSLGRSSSFHPHPVNSSHQLSSSAVKRKKHNPVHVSPVASSMPSNQHSSLGMNGRGQVKRTSATNSHDHTDTANVDSLIGRKVRTRWPDDNHFYEAVIYEYNPAEGLYGLVYDKGTPHETWEWVNLSEISPEDIQWIGEDPGVFHKGGYCLSSNGKNRPNGLDRTSGSGRGQGTTKSQLKREHFSSHNGVTKKAPDIKMLKINTLVKEVERIFNGNCLNPVEIDEATKLLKEHEQALVDAISSVDVVFSACSIFL